MTHSADSASVIMYYRDICHDSRTDGVFLTLAGDKL